jgi:hypothetical protein
VPASAVVMRGLRLWYAMSRMKDVVDLGAGRELQPICHLANAFQHHEGPEILRPELAMPLPTAD